MHCYVRQEASSLSKTKWKKLLRESWLYHETREQYIPFFFALHANATAQERGSSERERNRAAANFGGTRAPLAPPLKPNQHQNHLIHDQDQLQSN